MKKLLFVAFFALMSPVALLAQVDVEKVPSININITCDSLVSPDRFIVSLSIIDNIGAGKKGIETVEKDVLVKTLKSIGIDVKKDLVISNFYSTYDKKGKTVASKNYSLTVRSVNILNEVMEKLTDADIVIRNVEPQVSNQNEIMEMLKIKAIKSTRRDAEVMMNAVDCKIGRLLKVSYNTRIGAESNNMSVDNIFIRGNSMAKSVNQNESVGVYRNININVYLNVSYEIINR